MRTHSKIGLAVAGLLAFAGAARAAGPEPKLSSHEQAARELCRMVCGAGSLKVGGEMMTRVVQNPEIADLEDVFRGWYVSAMELWDREGDMAEDYMAAFSEPEMREILAFYRTPLGQKALAELPALARKEAELLGREMTAHQPELEAVLGPRLKEIEEGKEASVVRAAVSAGNARATEPPQGLSSHEQAARALYREIGGSRIREVRDNILAEARKNPVLAPVEDVFSDWYDGLIHHWDREGDLAQPFMAAFSEQELRSLLTFYQTPAGKELTEKLPKLSQKEAERCDHFLDEHEAELQILIAAHRSGRTRKEDAQISPP